MSEVVQSRAPRTYPLPQSVVAEAQQGQRWQRAYKVDASSSARWVATFLATGGSVTAEIVGVLASMMPSRPDAVRPIDPSSPDSDRIRWALYGGDPFLKWSGKIAGSVSRERDQAITAALEATGYDPSARYLGLTHSSDPSLVRAMIRVDRRDPAVRHEWTSSGEWRKMPDSLSLSQYDSLELDSELVAATASALLDSDGLVLMFDAPVARLAYQAITAAVDVSDASGTHYYAIVDSTDTTAVMNLISISPGPVVKVRSGGKWANDPKVTQKLLSVAPPPLVELDPSTLEMVMAQIDGTVNDAQTNPDYVESLGNEKAIEQKQADDVKQQAEDFARRRAAMKTIATDGVLTASVRRLQHERDARLVELERKIYDVRARDVAAREDFDSRMQSIRGAATVDSDELEQMQAEERARRDSVESEIRETQQLYDSESTRYGRLIAEQALESSAFIRQRIAVLASAAGAVPVFTASRPSDAQSETRKYWIAGRGPVRIKWNCEKGAVG